MRRARLAILAILALGGALGGLPGCASEPPAPLSPAQNAAALEARSLDDPGLQRFIAGALGRSSPAAARWGLARLTLAALYYHPALDLARAALAAAQAAVVTAGQRPNPTLSLAAAFGTAAAAGAIPAGAAPVTLGPVIDFLFETGDKREYRSAAARHRAAAARQDLRTATWQVRGRVRGALIDLWSAEGRLSLMHRRLALQDELVGLSADRLAAGAAASPEISRERVQRGQLALGLRDAEAARADARARLASAVGVPLAALDGAALSFGALDHPAAPPDLSAGGLRRRALTGRSDVAAALAQYEAAQSALQLAIAGRIPDVTLGPGYEYDFGVNKYLLGPSLSLPIFNRNEGPIAEAVAARQAAAARFTALQAAILGAIDEAVADLVAADAAVASGDALLADARRREAELRQSFAAGRIDRPMLVTAGIARQTVELSRFEALVRQRQALGRLEDALQQPLLEPAAALPAPEQSPRPAAGPAA